jgi:hypothetical protein
MQFLLRTMAELTALFALIMVAQQPIIEVKRVVERLVCAAQRNRPNVGLRRLGHLCSEAAQTID